MTNNLLARILTFTLISGVALAKDNNIYFQKIMKSDDKKTLTYENIGYHTQEIKLIDSDNRTLYKYKDNDFDDRIDEIFYLIKSRSTKEYNVYIGINKEEHGKKYKNNFSMAQDQLEFFLDRIDFEISKK